MNKKTMNEGKQPTGAECGEYEERLRRVIQDSPFPLMMHTEDGEVIMLSNTWLEYTGFSFEEMNTIDKWLKACCQEKTEELKGYIKGLYAEITSRTDLGEWAIKTAYGERIWEFSSTPLGRLPDGRMLVLTMARDITDQKNLERARTDFVFMLTHDLKSPLTTIMGYSDLLIGSLKERDKAEIVETIGRSADRMMRMIEDFLIVSRLEAEKMRITPTPEDIRHLLERVATDFMPAAKKKRIHLLTELSEVPPACVDSKYMERSVWNLLKNAIDYTPAGGRVVLKAESGFRGDMRRQGPYLAISVNDTGPGIAEEDKDRVFDKYFTAPKTKGIKGTGLGLAIVKAVAEAHGGRAAVESEPGEGSTFHIYLPLRTNCMKKTKTIEFRP